MGVRMSLRAMEQPHYGGLVEDKATVSNSKGRFSNPPNSPSNHVARVIKEGLDENYHPEDLL